MSDTRFSGGLRQRRLMSVRKYLASPASWPDGIDWGSHWYGVAPGILGWVGGAVWGCMEASGEGA